MKFQLCTKVLLEKYSFENEKQIVVDVWFPSISFSLHTPSQVMHHLRKAVADMMSKFDAFVQKGSGWVECTLDYPVALHDLHADYPLAPVKTKITYDKLSPYAQFLCDMHGLKSTLNSEKLGKTIENPEKRTKVKLCHSQREMEKYVGHFSFKCSKIITKNLVGVEMKNSFVKMNKPFYVGNVVLELSKFHMYNFHYNVMKLVFDDRISAVVHGHRLPPLQNLFY